MEDFFPVENGDCILYILMSGMTRCNEVLRAIEGSCNLTVLSLTTYKFANNTYGKRIIVTGPDVKNKLVKFVNVFNAQYPNSVRLN